MSWKVDGRSLDGGRVKGPPRGLGIIAGMPAALFRRIRLLAVAAAAAAVLGIAGPAMSDPDAGLPSDAGSQADVNAEPQAGADSRPKAEADSRPSTDPTFVDDFANLYQQVEASKEHISHLRIDLAAAQGVLNDAQSTLTLALGEAEQSEVALVLASGDVDAAVRTMYMSGSTDLGVVLGVLGSSPEQALRALDSVAYLRGVTGEKNDAFETSSHQHLLASSAAATALIRRDDAASDAASIGDELAKASATLKRQEKELERLIAAAAPQTVVGRTGCPKQVLEGTVPIDVSVSELCREAVSRARSPQAASAIKWALVRLGAPYACEGAGRLAQWRYDCSSFVSRAYAEAAGLGTAGAAWAPSTRSMLPWGGESLDPHYLPIPAKALSPGDLAFYDTCPAGETCDYRHVVMYLGPLTKGGPPYMVHTSECGGVANVAPFPGTDVPNFLGARRVVQLAGERLKLKDPKPSKGFASTQDGRRR